MGKKIRISQYLVVLLTLILLPACLQNSNKKPGNSDHKMILDKSATPASYSLIRLQERPLFQKDDRKRPYGMIEDIDDLSDKIRVGDKPLTIQEIKPN